jgi:hypothetical protein
MEIPPSGCSVIMQIPTFTTARQAEARMVKNNAWRHKPQQNINTEYNKL